MRQPVPFGKYLLLDRISVGGMAEVFKAKSYGVEGFEKIIAIKRILPTMGEDRDFIKMFIDEAKIAGQLAHANICQIFELGRIDGSHFIAMEYIWGKDLLQIQNRLRKIKQPMPVQTACFSMAKVLEGLDYAHRKRDPLGRPLEIVHRDCSPQNVLVSYEGEVKVIDFGIAKATSRNSRTMAGVLKGKFGYMSPEQVRGLPLDRRSDIFALGTMLYECLTSERLFQGETDFSTLEKVRNVDIRPPREINPNIPEAVERVILKALAKDVDDRYQWCSEMLSDLQQYLMSSEVVFTAKQLSAWLKEMFTGEIDKERQLLETYKRVGRDGLINNLPAAEAKLDVVENLGEAGAPEGDSTQLGGPSFEDLEAAVAASAGPALGSPASRGSAPLRSSSSGDDGDFGEEAPTEIFGEIDQNGKPISAPFPVAASGRPATSTQPPATRPPKPPPTGPQPRPPTSGNGRPGTAAQAALGASATAALNAVAQGRNESTMNVSDDELAAAQQPYAPAAYAQGSQRAGNMMNNTPPSPTAQGFQPPQMPVSPPQVANALSPAGHSQGKTLMGAAAPPGFGQYAQQYAQGNYPNPSGQMPGMPSGQLPGMNPSQPQMLAMGMNPSGQMGGYPSAQNYLGQVPQHGSGQHGGYGQYQQTNPAAALDQAPVEGRKKSSIARDVAIGVAIAAVVLGGFLAVKFLILDSDDSSSDQTVSSITSLRIKLEPDIEAELFLDGSKTREYSVKNNVDYPVNAGQRKIRIVAKDGQVCEKDVKLEAGQVTTVTCQFKATVGSGSGENPVEKTPDKPAGSGSAGSAGKTVGKTPDKTPDVVAKVPDVAKTPDKTLDKTLVKTPDIAKTPVKVPDIAKTPDKTPIKTPDIAKTPVKTPVKTPDKMPVEDNPADRAGAAEGSVTVTSKTKAKIGVDGADTGMTTTAKLKLSPGKHKISFNWGATKSAFTVVVKAGETQVLSKDE